MRQHGNGKRRHPIYPSGYTPCVMTAYTPIAMLRAASRPAAALLNAALLALAAAGAGAEARPAVYDVSAAGLQRFQDADLRQMTQATVTRHVDGDTFDVAITDPPPGMRTAETIRLLGIDTPELGEPLGAEAQDFTARRAGAGPVYLALDFRRRDRFDRLLAFVYLRDGTLLNAELLRTGLAAVYRADDLMYFFAQFEDLERDARQEGIGLWEGRTAGVVIVIIRNAGRAEHVELRNDGAAPVDISGWRIADDDGDMVSIPDETMLAPASMLAVGSGAGCVETPHPCLHVSPKNIWSNSGDDAALYDRGGTAVHRYSY